MAATKFSKPIDNEIASLNEHLPKLIWTNSNASAAFGAQTLSFDSNYSLFIIEYVTDGTPSQTVIVNAGGRTNANAMGAANSEFSGTFFAMYRVVESSSNSLSFHECGQILGNSFYEKKQFKISS